MHNNTILVEVAYALPTQQFIEKLELPIGSTAIEAITASNLSQKFPEITLASVNVGIFGKVCLADQLLNNADRVEVYRPLVHDPKEARRQRAKK